MLRTKRDPGSQPYLDPDPRFGSPEFASVITASPSRMRTCTPPVSAASIRSTAACNRPLCSWTFGPGSCACRTTRAREGLTCLAPPSASKRAFFLAAARWSAQASTPQVNTHAGWATCVRSGEGSSGQEPLPSRCSQARRHRRRPEPHNPPRLAENPLPPLQPGVTRSVPLVGGQTSSAPTDASPFPVRSTRPARPSQWPSRTDGAVADDGTVRLSRRSYPASRNHPVAARRCPAEPPRSAVACRRSR